MHRGIWLTERWGSQFPLPQWRFYWHELMERLHLLCGLTRDPQWWQKNSQWRSDVHSLKDWWREYGCHQHVTVHQ